MKVVALVLRLVDLKAADSVACWAVMMAGASVVHSAEKMVDEWVDAMVVRSVVLLARCLAGSKVGLLDLLENYSADLWEHK